MDPEKLNQLINKGVAKYRERMEGAELFPPVNNRVATAEAIRRFADGIGDRNPLWRDREYAAASAQGGLVAPPMFLNAVSEGQAFPGLPGLIATFVGSEWEWNELIREGDSFTASNKLLPLVDKSKGDGLAKFLQSGVITYCRQDGLAVGSCTWRILRSQLPPGKLKKAKPDEAVGAEKPAASPHAYSAEEAARIYQTMDAEEIRGGRPRCFEEVEAGDAVPQVVKGPLAISDQVAWAMGNGWHRLSLAHECKLAFLRDNPGLSYTDPHTGLPEPIGNSHLIPEAAGILMGSSLPLDVGIQRVCWLGHPVTNWMGDTGRMLRLACRMGGLVRFGDTVWLGGKVAGKHLEDGRGMVSLELEAANQLGRVVATGQALVELPLRARG